MTDEPNLVRPKMRAHFMSETVVWETPQPFFDKLNAEFGFETDVCAIAENAKCPRYFSPEMDGLAHEWKGVCWMNPPYGRGIDRWMRKAYESSLSGATVVCLIPSRTDTAWWHDYAAKGEIRFVRGRLNFGGNRTRGHNAPFPCAVVVFRPASDEGAKASLRDTQAAASDVARLQRPQCGGEIRCSGCGGTYEDAPGNFCSFCA